MIVNEIVEGYFVVLGGSMVMLEEDFIMIDGCVIMFMVGIFVIDGGSISISDFRFCYKFGCILV